MEKLQKPEAIQKPAHVGATQRSVQGMRNLVEMLLLIVVAVLLVLVSGKFYVRADATKDNIYSLTPASIKTVRSVEGRVNADLFLSRDLPPEAVQISERIKDLLSEYEARSGGRFRYRSIDPTNNPDAKRRAENMGIPELQMQAVGGDQLQIKRVYFGLALLYEDKKETIPALADITNLEYEITSRIIKLTREKPPVIAVADFSRRFSFEEQTPESRFTAIKDALRQRFEIRNIDLEKDLKIPEETETLLILNPMGLSEEAKYVIDQFVLNGGNLIAPIDAAMIPGQGLQAYPSLPGIETMLEKWGLTLKKQLVLDTSSAMATFSAGPYLLTMKYPMWVKPIATCFNRSLPPTSGLESLVLPWPGYFELSKDLPQGVTAEFLVKSTRDAWLMKSPFDLNPQQDWRTLRLNAETGEFTLAYAMTGKFPTSFKDGPPKIPEDTTEERKALLQSILNPETQLKEGKKQATVVAISSGRFLEDNYLQQFRENILFIENLLDWLSQGEDLITIRSRGITAHPLRQIHEPMKSLVKYGNIVGVPFLIVLFGIFRWTLRLKRRLNLKRKYLGSEEGEA